MDENVFLCQTTRLSPYLTEVPLSDLNESLRREIMPGEIAVTLNGCPRSAWSVTPESSHDRNSVLFTLAVGKVKSEKNYHWKALRSSAVLDVISMPGFLIVTLCGNESIAKLFIKEEERHPFDVEYFLDKAGTLVEPWRKCICQIFGELEGMDPESIDLDGSWNRLRRMVDRHAAGFSSKNNNENQEPPTAGEDAAGKQKGKLDAKTTRKVGKTNDKRARSTPLSVQPRVMSEIARTSLSSQVGNAENEDHVLPATPAPTLPAPGVSLPGRVARPKQTVSKKQRTKAVAPTPVPASVPLYSHPGVDDDDVVPESFSQVVTQIPSTAPEVTTDIANAGESSGGAETAAKVRPTYDRVDDVLNILPRPSAPKPTKVFLESTNSWSANPIVVDLDPNLIIPEELETEIPIADKSKKGGDKNAELRKRSLLNEKFARESEYMYIFGREQLFELALNHMEPSDHRSGRIYRDYEKAGAEDIKRNLILANFTKPVLTVMPKLQTRPRDWNECVSAGKFKIINGQHTWHAAISCLNDPVLRQTNPRIESLKIWDVQVVWSEKVSHLHALSFKCNEGNNESRHLTSLLRAILHCRVLWEQEGRPPMVRKNAALGKKKSAAPEESVSDSQVKSKYEVINCLLLYPIKLFGFLIIISLS